MVTTLRPVHRGVSARHAVLLVALVAHVAACGGGAEATKPSVPAPVAAVLVAPIPATLYVGASIQLVVTTTDAAGTTLAGRAVTFTSSNPAVATVGSSGSVTAVGVGATSIHVASEGKAADVAVVVTLIPVSAVLITPALSTIRVGGTVQFTAVARDSNGAMLPDRPITWTSSAPQLASVSPTGSVSSLAAGDAIIRASIGGKFADAPVTLSPVAAPVVSSISASPLSSGTTVTVTGANFESTILDNAVTIDGVLASVTAASTSQLTVVVPQLPCTPSHAARVQVATQGLAGAALQPVRAATPVAPVTGVPLLLTPTEAACAELPGGAGQYVVSVMHVGASPTTVNGFRLEGALPPAPLAATRLAPTTLRQAVAVPSEHGADDPAPDPLLRGATRATAERLRESVLESNRAIYARLRSLQPASTTRSLAPAPRHSAALPVVGETRKFRVAQFSTALNATGSCNNFVEITARVAYVGSHAVLFEDVAAPLANTMDASYQQVGQEFDDAMFGVDSTYFGDPLITDARTDADRRLNMVFTPQLTTGIAGFVITCDFFPRDSTNNRVSNFGETFYAVVPTVAGTGFSGNTVESWRRGIRHTIVHEVKHIASFGARLVNNASAFEEAWLEEGMARHAEELWERNFIYNVAWKGNSTYRSTLYCDVRPAVAECLGRPYAMFAHFATLYNVLDNPGASSIFGRVADGDFNFYSASWSLVRYALDRYATSEASFLRGITQSTSTRGMASLLAQTGGRPAAELLTNWSLAMYLDDTSTNPDLSLPTWNTRDIYAGMNKDFGTTNFTKPFPLVPTALGSPTFSVENAGIHAGSFAMYTVPANASAPSTLRLGAPGGTGSAVSDLRVAIVRTP